MNSDIQIISTADGSHSLFNRNLNETYHSVHGAVRESRHVFIKNGLDFFCDQSASSAVTIFEMGFGTGLNVWLTVQRAIKSGLQVHYSSLEAYPLPEAVWSQLNYASSPEEKDLFQKIHTSPWDEEVKLLPDFTLRKINASLLDVDLEPCTSDLIYFDAFAPSKQPELWEMSALSKIAKIMRPRGVFVTYCAKGQLKRDLKSLNLRVETLEGPPGKKEMVRALKN